MLVIVDSFRPFQFFKQNITIKTCYSKFFGADILTHYYSIQKYSQLINKNRSERTTKKKLGKKSTPEPPNLAYAPPMILEMFNPNLSFCANRRINWDSLL